MIEDVYQHAMERLRGQLTRRGVAFQDDEGELLVAGRRLALAVSSEGLVEQAGQVLAPLEIQLHVDGNSGDRFLIGTLGVGRNQSEAFLAAIDEWFQLAGDPVLRALLGDASGQTCGDWHAWAGQAVFRGQAPAVLRPGGSVFRQLVAELARQISQWPAPPVPTFRSATVVAAWAEGRLDLQAAIDGALDANWHDQVVHLAWPLGANPWLYKQMFVLGGG